MRPESAALLWDARRAAALAASFVEGLDEHEYRADLLCKSAVERQLEILGEALNGIRKTDPDTAQQISDVNRIVGMRNILAHGYAIVDDSVIYDAATTRLAGLLTELDGLLLQFGGSVPPDASGA